MVKRTMHTILYQKQLITKLSKTKDVASLYELITVSVRDEYRKASKKQRTKILDRFEEISGYSRVQLKRLFNKAMLNQRLSFQKKGNSGSFKRKYSNKEISLLVKFDRLSNYPNAFALITSMKQMVTKYNDQSFSKISNISHGTIYKIRKKNKIKYIHTSPVTENIGERRKPLNNSKPGFLRIDTVHGGDKDGEKGLYYINIVDEVTQYQVVASTPFIAESHLRNILESLAFFFPFRLINFHSDNGSEYINTSVASILNRLNISQTKSRPGKSNDNALVETKNGWVIRKHFGYLFKPKHTAPIINSFLNESFNEYLNYHRVCAFPEIHYTNLGKKIVTYPKNNYMTPYDKLKLVDPTGSTLINNLNYDKLDRIQNKLNHLEYLQSMHKSYLNMLKSISVSF